MKKILALSLVLVLSFLFVAGCGNGASQPAGDKTYTIRLGTPTGGKHQQNMTMDEFKKRIEAESDGKITVQLFPTSQLGTAAQMIEGVQGGTIEGVLIPSSYFASYAPAIAILDLPFLFATDGSASQQAYDILNAGTSLDKYLESKGFVVGGFLFCANRYILSTHKIDSMSDLAGKNIWALPSPTLQNELKAYGASPVTLDLGDIAVALQNGTVNGVCTDPTFYFSMSLYESAKFINKIPSSAMTNCFFFSEKWIKGLPSDVRELVLKTAKATVAEYEYDYMKTFWETAENKMVEAGVTIVEPSAALLAELQAASAGLHDTFKGTDKDCAAIYDEFRGLVDKK